LERYKNVSSLCRFIFKRFLNANEIDFVAIFAAKIQKFLAL